MCVRGRDDVKEDNQLLEVFKKRMNPAQRYEICHLSTLRFSTRGVIQDDYCTVEVWYRVWLRDANRLIVTGGPTCSTRGSRRQTPGGVSSRQIPGGISRPVPLGICIDVCLF